MTNRTHTILNAARRLMAGTVAAATLLAATALPAAASPPLWVVRSPTATVYLFGTVHGLPPKADWHSPVVDRALAASSEIWTEADPGSLKGLVRLIRRYGLSPNANTSVHAALPVRYRTRFAAEMSSAGLDVDMYGHVKPWLAELLLSGGTVGPAKLGRSVETDLLAYAAKTHKDTVAFESADAQFAILSDLPLDNQIRALEMQIEGFPTARGQMNELVRTWMTGDDQRLDSLSNRPLMASNERYFDDVIVRRNEHFAQALSNRLSGSGTAFVAVGAAHLVGTTSVQTFLHNYGFTATRIAN